MELKSNWSFLIKICLPFSILLGIVIIGYAISGSIEGIETTDIVLLSLLCFLELAMIVLIVAGAICKFPLYKFEREKICEYDKKGNLVNTVAIDDIQTIHYYSFKWHYFITIFTGSLREGGVWKLHITLKNGEKASLGLFAVKDVQKLKNEIYNDLIEIL